MIVSFFLALAIESAVNAKKAMGAQPSKIQILGTPSNYFRSDDGNIETVAFRTEFSNYKIDLTQLPSELRTSLIPIKGKIPSPIEIALDRKAIIRDQLLPKGVRANCSETSLRYDDFIKSAQKYNSKNAFVDFLKAIPAGTLQTFTLIYQSESAQAEGVNEMWPRVIRASIDGKLVIAYTCNPESKSYGTIEITHFEGPPSDRFQYSELDFRDSASNKGARSHRVNENPKECINCHAPSGAVPPDPRPNWKQYPEWTGVYGGRDDRITNRHAKEKESFLAFRNMQKDNSCYQSLPWLPASSAIPGSGVNPAIQSEVVDEKAYPYSFDGTSLDYWTRPNLKLTNTFSRLNAKRLARKFKSTPSFQRLQFLLALDTAGCEWDKMDAEISRLIPSYVAPPATRHGGYELDPRSEASGSARLYATGKAIGLSNPDWNLKYKLYPDYDDPTYNAGIPGNVGDITFARVVKSELFEEVGAKIPELKPLYSHSSGARLQFGPEYSCTDDLGSEVIIDPKYKNKVCELILAKYKAITPEEQPNVKPCGSGQMDMSLGFDPLVKATLSILSELEQKKLDPDRVARGKSLVDKTCRSCHSVEKGSLPKALQFFDSSLSR